MRLILLYVGHDIAHAQPCDKLAQHLTFHGYIKEDLQGELGPETWRIRRMDIQYFLEDHSVRILEPHVPNAGITGGVFLRRSPARRSDTRKLYLPEDFKVGRTIELFGRVFHLVDCDMKVRCPLLQPAPILTPPPCRPGTGSANTVSHRRRPSLCRPTPWLSPPLACLRTLR